MPGLRPHTAGEKWVEIGSLSTSSALPFVSKPPEQMRAHGIHNLLRSPCLPLVRMYAEEGQGHDHELLHLRHLGRAAGSEPKCDANLFVMEVFVFWCLI